MVEPTVIRSRFLRKDLEIAIFISLDLPEACWVCPLLTSISMNFPILEFAIAALIRLLMMEESAYPSRCAATFDSPTYIPVANSVAASPSRVSSSTEASSRVIVSSSGASRKKPIDSNPMESRTPLTRTPVRKSTRRVSSPSDSTSAFTFCEADTLSNVCPMGPLNAIWLPESTWNGMTGYIFGE